MHPGAPAAHSVYLVLNASGLNLDEAGRYIAAYVVASSFGESTAALEPHMTPEDIHVARRLGGVLRLAEAITRQRGTLRRADMMLAPLTIDYGLPQRLGPRDLAPVQEALECKLRVV